MFQLVSKVFALIFNSLVAAVDLATLYKGLVCSHVWLVGQCLPFPGCTKLRNVFNAP